MSYWNYDFPLEVTKELYSPDGILRQEWSDGTMVLKRPDGASREACPDGYIKIFAADGHFTGFLQPGGNVKLPTGEIGPEAIRELAACIREAWRDMALTRGLCP